MKTLSLLLFGYLMLVLQISLVPDSVIAGNRPNLILLLLCFALFWCRDARVFLWGILVGLVCETFDAAIPGTGALLLTGLTWLAYRVQIHFQIRSLFSRFVMMAFFTFAFEFLFPLLNRLEAKALPDLLLLSQQAAGCALYTAMVGLALLMSCKLVMRLLPVSFDRPMPAGGYESRYSH